MKRITLTLVLIFVLLNSYGQDVCDRCIDACVRGYEGNIADFLHFTVKKDFSSDFKEFFFSSMFEALYKRRDAPSFTIPSPLGDLDFGGGSDESNWQKRTELRKNTSWKINNHFFIDLGRKNPKQEMAIAFNNCMRECLSSPPCSEEVRTVKLKLGEINNSGVTLILSYSKPEEEFKAPKILEVNYDKNLFDLPNTKKLIGSSVSLNGQPIKLLWKKGVKYTYDSDFSIRFDRGINYVIAKITAKKKTAFLRYKVINKNKLENCIAGEVIEFDNGGCHECYRGLAWNDNMVSEINGKLANLLRGRNDLDAYYVLDKWAKEGGGDNGLASLHVIRKLKAEDGYFYKDVSVSPQPDSWQTYTITYKDFSDVVSTSPTTNRKVEIHTQNWSGKKTYRVTYRKCNLLDQTEDKNEIIEFNKNSTTIILPLNSDSIKLSVETNYNGYDLDLDKDEYPTIFKIDRSNTDNGLKKYTVNILK